MATENTGQKLLRKLTIRTCVGTKGDILAAAMTGRADDKATTGKAVPIMRVMGAVSGFRPGESDSGPYVKLLGQFKAVNLLTGEEFSNVSTCILPAVISDMVAAALAAGAQLVQFAVEIDVCYDEAAATFYTYEARSLLAPKESEPLTAIEGLLKATGVRMTAPKQLAAPLKLSPAMQAKQEEASKLADAKKGKEKQAA